MKTYLPHCFTRTTSTELKATSRKLYQWGFFKHDRKVIYKLIFGGTQRTGKTDLFITMINTTLKKKLQKLDVNSFKIFDRG